jgi:hypothetical protein
LEFRFQWFELEFWFQQFKLGFKFQQLGRRLKWWRWCQQFLVSFLIVSLLSTVYGLLY